MANISSVDRKTSFFGSKPPDSRPHKRVEDEMAVERKYTFGDVLGQGSFGVVREVTSRANGERFAIKIVHKDKPGSRSILMLTREVEVLQRLDHPHIIRLEEVLETPKKVYMVMEICRGGELTARLKLRRYFTEKEAKEVMRQLTEVVVYLHDNDIVHRDLKLENVLLKSPVDSTSNKMVIKLTDFGLAHMRNLSEMEDPMDQCCGTPYYMAPEVISSRHEYTKMCDVWSLGVIMYYLLCGKVPFQSDGATKLEESILKGEVKFTEMEWCTVSDKAKTLIKGMLCRDTTRRLTALRVLNDAWFTGQSSQFLSAIDLMRDLTGETAAATPHHTPTLETVPETTASTACITGQPHGRAYSTGRLTQQHRTLTDKRTQRSSTTSHPASTQLKFLSTTNLSSSGGRSPRQRSQSVGTRPATGQRSRISTQHDRTEQRTTPCHNCKQLYKNTNSS